MFTRTLVTMTTKPEQVPAYLYRTATEFGRVANPHNSRYSTAVLVTVTSEASEKDAQFLAEYQAARLDSGMHFTRVFDTPAEALVYVAERLS